MIIATVFWFHPLVWWIGDRLVTERERACDESVLSMSTEPRVYAESLLKVCRLSIESSLPCLSGVTGADLRRRIVSIMRLRAMPLGIAGRLVLTLVGVAAVWSPLALGVIQAQDSDWQMADTASLPGFEVASIKPSKRDAGHHWDSNEDRASIEGYSLRDLIVYAYGLKSNSQVLGGPDWIDKQHFDISAKVDDAEVAKIRAMSRREKSKAWNMMMQSLLANRFGLKVHPGQKRMPVFALVVAKSGSRCKPAAASKGYSLSIHNGHMTAIAISMDMLADSLTQEPESGHRVVVNRTGLTGDYDFAMDWTPDRGDGVRSDAQYPGLFTTLHEQLGLELKGDKAFVDAIVVDAAEKPEFDEH